MKAIVTFIFDSLAFLLQIKGFGFKILNNVAVG